MAQVPTTEEIAAGLGIRERVVLFCIASGPEWRRLGVAGDAVAVMSMKGLIDRDALDRLSLTEHGRAVVAALQQPIHPPVSS